MLIFSLEVRIINKLQHCPSAHQQINTSAHYQIIYYSLQAVFLDRVLNIRVRSMRGL